MLLFDTAYRVLHDDDEILVLFATNNRWIMHVCVGFVTLNSQFHVMMAYVNCYYNAIGAMIYYMLHLHKNTC
jgi:hypothetical protein